MASPKRKSIRYELLNLDQLAGTAAPGLRWFNARYGRVRGAMGGQPTFRATETQQKRKAIMANNPRDNKETQNPADRREQANVNDPNGQRGNEGQRRQQEAQQDQNNRQQGQPEQNRPDQKNPQQR